MAQDAALDEMTRAWQVQVGDGQKTSAVFEPALAAGAGALFVFAHGAGGHMADRSMLAATEAMHWLDGADHGFHVLKSSGRTDPDVLVEVGEACAAWLARARPGAPGVSPHCCGA